MIFLRGKAAVTSKNETTVDLQEQIWDLKVCGSTKKILKHEWYLWHKKRFSFACRTYQSCSGNSNRLNREAGPDSLILVEYRVLYVTRCSCV